MNWQRWRSRANKLRAHPRPLRFLVSRALWQVRLSHLLTAELPDGLRVRFYPSSISAALWVSGDARNDDVDFLRLALREGDTYIDCGANIGHLAMVARRIVGDAGAVTAIEANPRVYGYCVGNLELNHMADVVTLNVALGEARGTVRITDRRDDDQNRVGEGDAEVPLRPLDELIGDVHVNLLKLDVEGYELFVLRGATRTLANTDVVYCELSASNSERFGYRPSDAEQLLLDAGFVLARRRGDHWALVEGGVYETLTAEEQPRTGYNLVAIKRSALATVEQRFAERGQPLVK
jgi:FkbM family methyltransferase